MYTIAGMAERWWAESRRLKPREIVREYERTVLDELDLLREAANASQLKRNFAGSLAAVRARDLLGLLPRRPCSSWSASTACPSATWRGCANWARTSSVLAENGVEIFFTQVFRHNFFHADMHPGNIFVLVDNPTQPRYAAVDFGIVGTLDERDQTYLAENFLAVFNRDYRRVATLHMQSGWVPANTRVDQMESAVRTICEPIFDRPLKEISFGTVLLRLFEALRRFDGQIQPQLLLLQKTLLNIEGLGRQLYPELDIWQTASPGAASLDARPRQSPQSAARAATTAGRMRSRSSRRCRPWPSGWSSACRTASCQRADRLARASSSAREDARPGAPQRPHRHRRRAAAGRRALARHAAAAALARTSDGRGGIDRLVQGVAGVARTERRIPRFARSSIHTPARARTARRPGRTARCRLRTCGPWRRSASRRPRRAHRRAHSRSMRAVNSPSSIGPMSSRAAKAPGQSSAALMNSGRTLPSPSDSDASAHPGRGHLVAVAPAAGEDAQAIAARALRCRRRSSPDTGARGNPRNAARPPAPPGSSAPPAPRAQSRLAGSARASTVPVMGQLEIAAFDRRQLQRHLHRDRPLQPDAHACRARDCAISPAR